ncbi:unnamed protein product [Mytilus coruscus]|uniref:Uncharacterized protein n=1 Tax=Mytilus coruscus TaxID=42192 RepID=A0A6J8DJ85_MYTCO|nr:unnamed protein product [Mytilus coruscus]
MEKKRDDTNLKMEKTEDHSPVMMIGQGKEQTAYKGETIGKLQNSVIEDYTTPCHSKDVQEDADYTMRTRESPSPKCKPVELCETDDIIQTRKIPSPNFKPNSLCEADEKGQRIPTISHSFNEKINNCGKKINQSKVNAAKPKETSMLITQQKLHLLVQSIVKENTNLENKKSASKQIIEENINVNEDSQSILTCRQLKQTPTKHQKGENKDLKQIINRNSYQKQLSQLN